MSQDMLSGSPPVPLKLYCASQITWGPCCNADYDPEGLGDMRQHDLGCALKASLNKLPLSADADGPQTHTWSSKLLHDYVVASSFYT